MMKAYAAGLHLTWLAPRMDRMAQHKPLGAVRKLENVLTRPICLLGQPRYTEAVQEGGIPLPKMCT